MREPMNCTHAPSTVTGRSGFVLHVQPEFGGVGPEGIVFPDEVGAIDAPDIMAAGGVWKCERMFVSLHTMTFLRR